jgi:ADP-dependent NAD(P)H-hydrate dehydratase / NAD(P)H-hydrate epimerase
MALPVITPEQVAALVPQRISNSHKGTYGHACMIAGHKGRMGAAVLSAAACLRTGAGLLTVLVPEAERAILQSSIPEAMLLFRETGTPVSFEKYNAVGIGPGMGTGREALELLENLLEDYRRPLLIDADALTLLSGHRQSWSKIPAGSILTPHPKEFDRLFGDHDTPEQRIEKAISLSIEHEWVIVLKNNTTLVASGGKAWLNTKGNAGLAKGGSGDVLSGMITALLAQSYAPEMAAIIGVYLHAVAADIAVKDQSMESLLATDVIAAIGKAFNSLR